MKAVYWLEGSELAPAAIDSSLFTHAFYAFVGFDRNTNQVVVPITQNFGTFTATVQERNLSIKTLISIGGGNFNGGDFAAMASSAPSRLTFIKSTIELAITYGFHGLDLDWEYPTNITEMENLGVLLDEWRAAVASQASSSGMAPLLLTAAVFYSSGWVNGLNYPVERVARNLDWINVMSYDIYGPVGSPDHTRPPAALRDRRYAGAPSVEAGIQAWRMAGMPAEKIALGLPFYGWAWKLSNFNNHGLFAAAAGADTTVSPDGAVAYSRIQALIRQNNANVVYDPDYVSYYCYYRTTWIGYDDKDSISAKVKYARDNGLLGYFAWQAANDDNWTLSRAASDAWGA